MRLRKLTLRHFRNVTFASLEFSGRRQFFVGANGQGKTNLLEAAGFLTALRSFRTSEPKLLLQHGQRAAAIGCTVEHAQQGETRVAITLHQEGKEVWCDQTRVTRLADFIGKFPTVVFSSQDMQLVRGSPALRRKWLDLTLSAMDPEYLRALQVFTRALAERNILLKKGNPADKQLDAFEQTLAPAAAEVIARRAAGIRTLAVAMRSAYGGLTDGGEPATMAYAPNFAEASAEALLARYESGRVRDAQFRTTLVGPHRDELDFRVRGSVARDFASEGQQRSIVLALRLAQVAWFREKSSVQPVLLCDDVLGELDPDRRRRFWKAVTPEAQVLATGTSLPDAELGEWQVVRVEHGNFDDRPAGSLV